MRTGVWLWRWRRNPLRRRSDHVQAWALLSTVAAVAVSAPVAGLVTANAASDLARERPAPHRATAELLRTPAAGGAARNPGDASTVSVQTQARWRLPDGSWRLGTVPAPVDSKAHDKVTVWLDDRGERRAAPPGPTAVDGQCVAAGLLGAAGTTLTATAGYTLLRRRLEAARARRWEWEWAEVGPYWSGSS